MPISNRGQALIEILVAAGVVGIVGMASLSLIGTQVGETKAVGERLAGLDVERTLLALLTDGTVCAKQFAGRSVPQGSDGAITVDWLPASGAANAPAFVQVGQPLSPLAKNMVVTKIQLTNFSPTGLPNSYLADLQVVFDSAKLQRAIRPVKVQTGISTNAAGAIVTCSSSGAGLCTPGPKLYIGTDPQCNMGNVAADPSHWSCSSAYLGTLCKTQ